MRPLQGGMAFVVVLLCVLAQPAEAQRGRVTTPPGQLVSAFAREQQSASAHGSASLDLAAVLLHPADYPASYVNALLRELEQLALTGSPAVRGAAASRLAIAGSRRSRNPVPTFARLERIYRREATVRSAIVLAMADQAERSAALAFVRQIAVQPAEREDFPGAASTALNSLLAMGEEGRAVLRELHETGAVREPGARLELSVLASRGYRIPN